MEHPISKNIKSNIDTFNAIFTNCDDIKKRKMFFGKYADVECFIAYVEITANDRVLTESILGKMYERFANMSASQIKKYLQINGPGIMEINELKTVEAAAEGMLTGDLVFFIEGHERAYKLAGNGYPHMGVQKPRSEQVIRGSHEGFADSVKSNTALIRKRIRSTKLKVKEIRYGIRSNTTLALVYMEDIVRPEYLKQVEDGLEKYIVDGVTDSGMVEQILENSWKSPFPQFQTTERPDKAAMAVLDGRVVLLSDNSPIGLLLPTNYNCFFQTSDDYYNRWQIATLERIIRYMASFLTIFFPALYLAVTNFHTQVLPTELILSFAAARKGVPFPAVIELLIMELAFELLREAGIRIPGNMGNAIGIVGGLIVGQAAVEANLVSPIVVIVVALTALSSFAVPNEGFVAAFRIIKFGLIFLATLGGFYGVLIGTILILIHLSGLKSFGIPYLMPIVGAELNNYQDARDTIIRQPFFRLPRRSSFARNSQKTRLKRKGE